MLDALEERGLVKRNAAQPTGGACGSALLWRDCPTRSSEQATAGVSRPATWSSERDELNQLCRLLRKARGPHEAETSDWR